jgi:hypothetical protein
MFERLKKIFETPSQKDESIIKEELVRAEIITDHTDQEIAQLAINSYRESGGLPSRNVGQLPETMPPNVGGMSFDDPLIVALEKRAQRGK